MKNIFVFFFAVFLTLITGNAQSTLIDRGGGLIYDNVLDITWLQDANYAKTSGYDSDGLMTLTRARDWANQLVYGGFDDWRLPINEPLNGISFNYNDNALDGSMDNSPNVSAPGTIYAGSTASEMAHLYYNSLGNKSYVDPIDTSIQPQPDWGLKNTGPFVNFLPDYYFFGTEAPHHHQWYFDFYNGDQSFGRSIEYESYAWAVRSGDVIASPIPEPSTFILLGAGLAGLAAARYRRSP